MESSLIFTLPLHQTLNPSWNKVSAILKCTLFGHFSILLLPPTGLSCHHPRGNIVLVFTLLLLTLLPPAVYSPLRGQSDSSNVSHILALLQCELFACPPFWSPRTVSNIITWWFYFILPLLKLASFLFLQYSEQHLLQGHCIGSIVCLANCPRYVTGSCPHFQVLLLVASS